MANLCIKTPSSAIQVLKFQLLVLRPRPNVRVLISNSSASVVALTAFVRLLPHVRPHLYLKDSCVYGREALVSFVCLLASICHLLFLQLMGPSCKIGIAPNFG